MTPSMLLILSITLFAISLLLLVGKSSLNAPVTFVLLAFLHALIGGGYLFLLAYRHWSWGERYPLWDFVDFSETLYVYVFLLCLTLLFLSLIRFRASYRLPSARNLCLENISLSEYTLGLILCLVYFVGIAFGTLRTGIGPVVALPLRLNGIIELVILFLLPLYVSLYVRRWRRGFWWGMAFFLIYGAFNIGSFGAKKSAIYPLTVFISIVFLSGQLKISRLLLPALAVLSLYVLINPWHIRETIRDDSGISPTQALVEGAEIARYRGRGIDFVQRSFNAVHNFSHRITGAVPTQIAIDESISLQRWSPGSMISDVREYYNRDLLGTPPGGTHATGHMGYFMLRFQNHVLGFAAGLLILLVCFYVCLRFDRAAAALADPRQSLMGVTFVLMVLPFLHDGNYGILSGYLHLAVSLVAVKLLFFPLLEKQLPEQNTNEQPELAEREGSHASVIDCNGAVQDSGS